MKTLFTSSRRIQVRALHIAMSLPLGALVYAPEWLALAARPYLQAAIFPVLGLSGLLMWQGHRLHRPTTPIQRIAR